MVAPTVLVLDDNAAFVRVVQAAAAQSGYTAVATDDPDAFVAELSRPEVVAAIVDCVVGDRNGLGILSAIGEQRADLPVLVVSGYGETMLSQAEQIARMRNLSRLSTLAKPFGLDALRGFLSGARADASA